MINLNIPIPLEEILKLNVGDNVLLNGTILTARDKAHLYLLEEDFEKAKDSVLYHCGPIIKDKEVIAAGPTTSGRMNRYTPDVIDKYGVKAVIGKGGMDKSVLEALKGRAVYFSAIGGAAVVYADAIDLKGVYKPEFGMPEAIWEFYVKDFPVIVAMDAHGNSLYEKVADESKDVFRKLIE